MCAKARIDVYTVQLCSVYSVLRTQSGMDKQRKMDYGTGGENDITISIPRSDWIKMPNHGPNWHEGESAFII